VEDLRKSKSRPEDHTKFLEATFMNVDYIGLQWPDKVQDYCI